MSHSPEELLAISPAISGMKPLPLAPGRGKELFLLKERFSRLCVALEDHPDMVSRSQCETAYALWPVALTANSEEILRFVFEFWMACGPMGWILANRFISSLMEKKNAEMITSALESMPEVERLLLLNHFYQISRPVFGQFETWASKSLSSPQKRSPVDWHRFIFALAVNDAELAIPLKDALAKSDYSSWLNSKLKSEDNSELKDDLLCISFIGPRAFLDTLEQTLARQNEKDNKLILATLKTSKNLSSKTLAKMVFTIGTTTKDKDTACLCLETLQAMNTSQTKLFTFFLKKHPDFKRDILARVINTNSMGYSEISDSLGDEDRDFLDKTVFALLLDMDPEWVIIFISNYLDNVPRKYSMAEKTIGMVREFLDEYREKNFNLPELEDTVFEAVPEKKQRKNPIQTISELFFKKPQIKSKDKMTKFREGVDAFGLDMSGSAIEGMEIEGRTISFNKFRDGLIKNCLFESVIFKECDFSGCLVENTHFNNCQFDRCHFDKSFFRECIIQWAFMRSTSMKYAVLAQGKLTGLVCARSDFSGIRFNNMEVSRITTRETGYTNAIFEESTFSACRFSAADFSFTKFVEVKVIGVEFEDCLFHKPLLAKVNMSASWARASVIRDALAIGVEANAPKLLDMVNKARRKKTMNTLSSGWDTAMPEWAASDDCLDLILLMVDSWYMQQELLNRESGYLRENRRRQDMAGEILPNSAKDFLTLCPHLLQTGVLEESIKVKPLAPVRLTGYYPSYYTWELLQKLYTKFTLDDPPQDAPIVSSVFMTGFYGTLAQKPQSRLECLIVLKSDNQPEDWLLAFQKKLTMLEEYAMDTFQLDIKFSLTNMSGIKSGGFEYLNRPKPAMDMSALEQEHFCRTGVHMLGMAPICELLPPTANFSDFSNFIEMLEALPFPWEARYENMNIIPKFDKEIFYSGCLARIASYATAPFEAAIRYAQFLDILFKEKYHAIDICKKLRENRLERNARLEKLDPYGALLMEILPLFRDNLPASSTDILLLAFILKTECIGQRAYGPNHGAKTTLISKIPEIKENLAAFRTHLGHSRQDFGYLVKTGRALSVFLHSGLEHILSHLRAHPDILPISEEELRSVEALSNSAFIQEKGKIQRVPFLNSMTNYFQLIIFYKEKPPAKQPYYVARGVPAGLKVKKENLQEIKQDPSIAALILWFAVNGIVSQRVEADYSLSPVREQDLKDLFKTIAAFIQNGFVPDRDLKYVSKPKVIKKALLLLNLNTKRDVNVIFETDVAYITSWGDIFHNHIKVFGDKLQKHPCNFLKKNLTHPLLPAAALEYWKPMKARCPVPVGVTGKQEQT